MEHLPDHEHLKWHAQQLFPGSHVTVTYPADEVINIQIDDRVFIFEVGSDDDFYIFTDGRQSFEIPLMDQE